MIEKDDLPLLTTEEDGIQHIGEILLTVGFFLPLAVSNRYPSKHPVTWFLKGVVLLPIIPIWILTVGVTVGLVGVVLEILGSSWNDMKERRDNDE